MKTAPPSPADALGCVVYLLLMNGGRIDRVFLSDVGAALRTFDDDDDDGDIEGPADGAPPAASVQQDAVEAPASEVALLRAGLLGVLVDFVL